MLLPTTSKPLQRLSSWITCPVNSLCTTSIHYNCNCWVSGSVIITVISWITDMSYDLPGKTKLPCSVSDYLVVIPGTQDSLSVWHNHTTCYPWGWCIPRYVYANSMCFLNLHFSEWFAFGLIWSCKNFSLWFNWATTWQNQQNECAPSEDSDQPGHPPRLIRVFAVRLMGS